jgi:Ca2+/Na+ antiporter
MSAQPPAEKPVSQPLQEKFAADIQQVESSIEVRPSFAPRIAGVLMTIEGHLQEMSGGSRQLIRANYWLMSINLVIFCGLMLMSAIPVWEIVFWLIAFVITAYFVMKDVCTYARNIKVRIGSSPLITKMLLGDEELAQIYDHTPWPWSLIFLGHRPRNLDRWVILLATNLDWYMAEPQQLFRWQWAGVVTYFAIGLAVLPIAIFVHGFPEMVVYFGIVPFCLLSMFSNGCRRAVGLEMMRDYLRERFSDSSSGTQT